MTLCRRDTRASMIPLCNQHFVPPAVQSSIRNAAVTWQARKPPSPPSLFLFSTSHPSSPLSTMPLFFDCPSFSSGCNVAHCMVIAFLPSQPSCSLWCKGVWFPKLAALRCSPSRFQRTPVRRAKEERDEAKYKQQMGKLRSNEFQKVLHLSRVFNLSAVCPKALLHPSNRILHLRRERHFLEINTSF